MNHQRLALAAVALAAMALAAVAVVAAAAAVVALAAAAVAVSVRQAAVWLPFKAVTTSPTQMTRWATPCFVRHSLLTSTPSSLSSLQAMTQHARASWTRSHRVVSLFSFSRSSASCGLSTGDHGWLTRPSYCQWPLCLTGVSTSSPHCASSPRGGSRRCSGRCVSGRTGCTTHSSAPLTPRATRLRSHSRTWGRSPVGGRERATWRRQRGAWVGPMQEGAIRAAGGMPRMRRIASALLEEWQRGPMARRAARPRPLAGAQGGVARHRAGLHSSMPFCVILNSFPPAELVSVTSIAVVALWGSPDTTRLCGLCP
mmetsp:Transcript_37837/g.75833  ORF Transcript_37837/g.75833 Transcript_37837/m.75833 type:complete len:313 (-) Transcript_37837:141-1079(-)